jgi:hypothetical protein
MPSSLLAELKTLFWWGKGSHQFQILKVRRRLLFWNKPRATLNTRPRSFHSLTYTVPKMPILSMNCELGYEVRVQEVTPLVLEGPMGDSTQLEWEIKIIQMDSGHLLSILQPANGYNCLEPY